MRYLLLIAAYVMPSALMAETTAVVRCEFDHIPTVTIYYETASNGYFTVADHGPASFSGGSGSFRLESGQLGPYEFRWAPANWVMDVDGPNGDTIISEPGSCHSLDVNGNEPILRIEPAPVEAHKVSVEPDTVENESCKIEAFNWTQSSMFLSISGSTSCSKGDLAYRLYNDSDEFIGASTTHIDSFMFDTVLRTDRQTDSVNLRYVISE